MQVFGVRGPGAPGVVSDLADRLSGRVAVVREGATDAPDGPPEAATTYTRTPDGWTITRDDQDVASIVDDLAPDHAYAILLDIDAAIPSVALGGATATDTLVRADEAETLDLAEVVAAVEDLESHETLSSLVARIKDAPQTDRAGAIATFTGRVRARDSADDSPTEYLEFETYDGVAEDRMAAIETDLEARDGVWQVVLHHRTGIVEAGEDIVFVVVLAGHRDEAFAAVRDGIDRLKDEVPIFKREVTTDETFWVHEREA